jgi:hypothetical protein
MKFYQKYYTYCLKNNEKIWFIFLLISAIVIYIWAYFGSKSFIKHAKFTDATVTLDFH